MQVSTIVIYNVMESSTMARSSLIWNIRWASPRAPGASPDPLATAWGLYLTHTLSLVYVSNKAQSTELLELVEFLGEKDPYLHCRDSNLTPASLPMAIPLLSHNMVARG